MYYKYRTKNKSNRMLKLFAVIFFVSAAVFFAYKYRTQLMFWKSGFNKLTEIVSVSERDTSAYEKNGGIQSALQKAAKFREDDPMNPEAFIVSAKLSFISSRIPASEKVRGNVRKFQKRHAFPGSSFRIYCCN